MNINIFTNRGILDRILSSLTLQKGRNVYDMMRFLPVRHTKIIYFTSAILQSILIPKLCKSWLNYSFEATKSLEINKVQIGSHRPNNGTTNSSCTLRLLTIHKMERLTTCCCCCHDDYLEAILDTLYCT